MIRRIAFATMVALVVAYAPQPVGAVPPEWTIVDLGTLGGTESTAVAINDRGQVVGKSSTTEGAVHGFLWQAGEMTDLGPGFFPAAINNLGQVVGTYSTTGPDVHFALWEDGVITDLGSLGCSCGPPTVQDINDRGQIVGSLTPEGNALPFLWEDGVMTDLGNLGGSGVGIAFGINDRGQVVGISRTAEPGMADAFLWEDGVMIDLGRLGGYSAVGNDINDRGQVVGTSTISMDGEQHAFLWEDGVMIDLGPQYANAINEHGQIVGSYMGDDGHSAVVWENGAVTELGRLGTGSRGSVANDINNRGQIVGYSWAGASLDTHAVLWTDGPSGEFVDG